jgi:hypothetical protein
VGLSELLVFINPSIIHHAARRLLLISSGGLAVIANRPLTTELEKCITLRLAVGLTTICLKVAQLWAGIIRLTAAEWRVLESKLISHSQAMPNVI